MSEKVKNYSLALAAILITIIYAISAVSTYMYHNRLETARIECAKQGKPDGVSSYDFNDKSYSYCMHAKGLSI